MPILTLTTDFGTRDWFVGTMKGVILRLNPRAVLVDLTHEIPPGDIRSGAFALAASYKFFPRGTIHIIVVDPGVGSTRRAVAVRTSNYFFVGPDNGVLSLALRGQRIIAAHCLNNERYFLKPVSHTFHGRDVFAPVAAHLSQRGLIEHLGPSVKSLVQLDWPKARKRNGRIEGEIVHFDHFGNATTNIQSSEAGKSQVFLVFGRRRTLCPLKSFYQASSAGKPIAVPGSSGWIEIAVNGGSAEKRLGLRIGARVVGR